MEIHIISGNRREGYERQFEQLAGCQHMFDVLHLRDKSLSKEDMFLWASQALEMGIHPKKIMINHFPDVADSLHVKGVQLGYGSSSILEVKENFPSLLVGTSVHSYTEAKMKERLKADFLILGHIFETPSHPNIPPIGISTLKKVKETVSIPVIAIGGVTVKTLPMLLKAEVDGVAIRSTVWKAKHIEKVLAMLHEKGDDMYV
ncbi:DUF561 domain-containing protein [Heyndrickxia ginsengihumi]|uniref:DUF561 domain-containing protein n=1 Tax=Heyndrickxia ginsengihumi TaxID=363870 RepID=UPI002040BD83|nr:DUF561 domain-containing protein [Heyndrickxia ginsengihumi]